jgi:VWFA-related protein
MVSAFTSGGKPKLPATHLYQTMKCHVFLSFCLSLSGVLSVEVIHAQTQESNQTPAAKIKTQTILVNEPVTVRNADGRMVPNLEPKDFKITDNGVEQIISHFEVGGDSISLVVLVETSSRIDALLPDLRKCGSLASQIVMGPNAEAAVVGFNDSVDMLQDFTSSGDAIERTFAHLDDGTSGRRLYDAMELAVEMLSSRPVPTATNPGRRRVMLVLAESDDKGSKAKLGAVLRRAQLENVTIWSVGLSTVHATLLNRAKMKPSDPGWGDNNLISLAAWAVKNTKDHISKNGLQIATAATGGTHFATWRDRSIQTAIDEIGGELHSQYLLMYTPTGTNAEGYHEIRVEVDKSNLKVRWRPGYFVEGPPNS